MLSAPSYKVIFAWNLVVCSVCFSATCMQAQPAVRLLYHRRCKNVHKFTRFLSKEPMLRVVLDFIAKFLYNIERETAAGSTVFGRWMTAFSIVLPFQEGACINMALLSTSNLRKAFGAEDLFSGVSFEIQSGDRIGLVGVNGSGKTTLFTYPLSSRKNTQGRGSRSTAFCMRLAWSRSVRSRPRRKRY